MCVPLSTDEFSGGIQDLIPCSRLLEALASSPLVFPTDEMESQLHDYKVLSAEEEQAWNELFQAVVQG